MQQIEQTLKNIEAYIERKPEFEAYQDYFDTLRALGEKDKLKSYEHNLWLRQESAKKVMGLTDVKEIEKFFNLSKKTYLYMARDDFDSYCLYLEWGREPSKDFINRAEKLYTE